MDVGTERGIRGCGARRDGLDPRCGSRVLIPHHISNLHDKGVFGIPGGIVPGRRLVPVRNACAPVSRPRVVESHAQLTGFDVRNVVLVPSIKPKEDFAGHVPARHANARGEAGVRRRPVLRRRHVVAEEVADRLRGSVLRHLRGIVHHPVQHVVLAAGRNARRQNRHGQSSRSEQVHSHFADSNLTLSVPSSVRTYQKPVPDGIVPPSVQTVFIKPLTFLRTLHPHLVFAVLRK